MDPCVYMYMYISFSLVRIPLSTMQWSYIFYIREKSPNILYNILGLYRAVLVRDRDLQFRFVNLPLARSFTHAGATYKMPASR